MLAHVKPRTANVIAVFLVQAGPSCEALVRPHRQILSVWERSACTYLSIGLRGGPRSSVHIWTRSGTHTHIPTRVDSDTGTAPVRWSKECEEVDVDLGDDVDVEADADVQEGVEYESAAQMEVKVVEDVCTGSDSSVDTYAHAHAHAYPTNVQLNVYLHVHTLCRC